MVTEDNTFTRVTVRQDILQAVLNYLMSRPAGETWKLIAQLNADVTEKEKTK